MKRKKVLLVVGSIIVLVLTVGLVMYFAVLLPASLSADQNTVGTTSSTAFTSTATTISLSVPPSPSTVYVFIEGEGGGNNYGEQSYFMPGYITVTINTTVIWSNQDSIVHTATSTTGAFDSGDLQPGQQYSYTFTKPGVYLYDCESIPS